MSDYSDGIRSGILLGASITMLITMLILCFSQFKRDNEKNEKWETWIRSHCKKAENTKPTEYKEYKCDDGKTYIIKS